MRVHECERPHWAREHTEDTIQRGAENIRKIGDPEDHEKRKKQKKHMDLKSGDAGCPPSSTMASVDFSKTRHNDLINAETSPQFQLSRVQNPCRTKNYTEKGNVRQPSDQTIFQRNR